MAVVAVAARCSAPAGLERSGIGHPRERHVQGVAKVVPTRTPVHVTGTVSPAGAASVVDLQRLDGGVWHSQSQAAIGKGGGSP